VGTLPTTCLVDASALVAAADRAARQHRPVVEALERADYVLVVPLLALAEAIYLIGSRFGPRVEAEFLRGLKDLDLHAPYPEDFERIATLVEQYRDLPLGGIDASIVALAERLGANTVATLDRRHFSVVRPAHSDRFEIVPPGP
jgi:hypothetical protein